MACCFCRCVRIPDAVTRRRKNLVRHYMNWRIGVGKGCFTWLKSVPSSAFPKDQIWKTTLMNLSPFIHISEVSVVTIRVARSVQMFVTLLLRQAVSLEERLWLRILLFLKVVRGSYASAGVTDTVTNRIAHSRIHSPDFRIGAFY